MNEQNNQQSWSKPEHVPGPLCWLRYIGGDPFPALVVGFGPQGVLTFEKATERNVSWKELAERWEHSTDRINWHPCTVASPVPASAEQPDAAAKVRVERQQSEKKTNELFLSMGQQLDTAIAERDSLRAELAREKARLDGLAEMLASIPDLRITFTDDPDTEDDIGMIPVGWNLRCNSVCREPLAINAPEFRAAIDSALSTQAQDSLTGAGAENSKLSDDL